MYSSENGFGSARQIVKARTMVRAALFCTDTGLEMGRSPIKGDPPNDYNISLLREVTSESEQARGPNPLYQQRYNKLSD